MGLRRAIGTIIIIIAGLGLIINFGVLVIVIIPECILGTALIAIGAPDLTRCDESYISFGIGIVVGFFWLGVGFVIRGKEQSFQLG